MKNLVSLLSITTFMVIGKTTLAQNETYYNDPGCKFLFFEASSSKITIYYGNGMSEIIENQEESEILIATVSNTFIKNGYEISNIIDKETRLGYFFFTRKDEK